MVIGIDIGGSKILAVASSDGYTFERQEKVATPADYGAGLIEIKRLIRAVSGHQIPQAIAISSPGPVDLNQGLIRNPPNLPGWAGAPIKADLETTLKRPVSLERDANAAALAEANLGAGKGYKYVLYLTISTGIGTGFVINNQVYYGAHDTEGGHITIDNRPDAPVCGCGGRGHFEAVVSGPAIKARFGRNAYEISEPEIWDQIAADIAAGLSSLMIAFSPDVVVLGGGVNTHLDRFEDFLARHLIAAHRLYPLPPILASQHLETAPILGVLQHAFKLVHNA